MPVRFDWAPQPASPGSVRAEISWIGDAGCAGRLASVLIGWPVRFEVTEDPSAGCDGERYAFTPGLGLFHAMTSANGDLVVPENRLRQLFAGQLARRDGRREIDADAEGRPLEGIRRLLGEPGTPNSSRSGTPAKVRRCAGSTRSSKRPVLSADWSGLGDHGDAATPTLLGVLTTGHAGGNAAVVAASGPRIGVTTVPVWPGAMVT